MATIRGFGLALALAGLANANEVTVSNDSLGDNSSGVIVTGFAAGEGAASWLTTPCDGNIVAAQVFWRSQDGTADQVLGDSLDIYRAGTFPNPGSLAVEIGGPVLTDGVINEYRYLDENNTIPLMVPVVQDETFVLSFVFADAPPAPVGPSVVRDTDGITAGHNALYGDIGAGLQWHDAATVGISGDWVLRAVVNCQAISTVADVGVTLTADLPAYVAGAGLTYTITVANAGPASAPGVTVVDAFPQAYTGVTWTCAASGAASCTASGSGTIAQTVSLPAASQVVFSVDGTVAAGPTGTLGNSATAVVAPPQSDPATTNNTAALNLDPAAIDLIFADGFEAPARAAMASEAWDRSTR